MLPACVQASAAVSTSRPVFTLATWVSPCSCWPRGRTLELPEVQGMREMSLWALGSKWAVRTATSGTGGCGCQVSGTKSVVPWNSDRRVGDKANSLSEVRFQGNSSHWRLHWKPWQGLRKLRSLSRTTDMPSAPPGAPSVYLYRSLYFKNCSLCFSGISQGQNHPIFIDEKNEVWGGTHFTHWSIWTWAALDFPKE